jgi:hypothetical protein
VSEKEPAPAEEPAQRPSRRSVRSRRRSTPGLTQLVAYIFVNILVSAATMFAVLLFWEQRIQQNQSPCVMPTLAPSDEAASEGTVEPFVAAIPPLEEEVLRIDNIFGAGYYQEEQVVLVRVGSGDLSLQGWWLEDDQGNRFDFPANLTLKPDATLYLNSRVGESGALSLFWGAEGAVWQIGETAHVYDPLGNLRAEYTIP